MIVVRNVFQAKGGRSRELAQAMAESLRRTAGAGGGSQPSGWRVLTDITGPFDTVVLEVETGSLAEWEQAMRELFASPEFQADLARFGELTVSGHRTLYTIEAHG